MPKHNDTAETLGVFDMTPSLDTETVATMTRYFAAKTWRAINGKSVEHFKVFGANDFTACVLATVQRQSDSIQDAEKIEKAVESSMEARFNLVATPEEQERACSKIDALFSVLPESLRQQAGKSLRRKLYGAKLGDARVTPAIAALLSYMNLPSDYWE